MGAPWSPARPGASPAPPAKAAPPSPSSGTPLPPRWNIDVVIAASMEHRCLLARGGRGKNFALGRERDGAGGQVPGGLGGVVPPQLGGPGERSPRDRRSQQVAGAAGAPAFPQGHVDGPVGAARLAELPGAVERVDDPDPAPATLSRAGSSAPSSEWGSLNYFRLSPSNLQFN